MINYIYYPNTQETPKHLIDTINAFKEKADIIDSNKYELKSNEVLNKFIDSFKLLGYKIESSKSSKDKISIPVLYGLNDKIIKKFEADAYNEDTKTVVEVEAGRGVLNNQFLKDYFEACVMLNVEYCVIAIRNTYRNRKDFEEVKKFFDVLYGSNKIKTDLKGLLIIGY